MTDHSSPPDPAADWLLAAYDNTEPWYTEAYDEDADEDPPSEYLHPMFELKSDMELGTAMRVIAEDYLNPDRRWL